jgi:iron-sulfur cluster assembly accessory protein
VPAQTPAAAARLRALLAGPEPKLIRIGVKNKGCAGLTYHLDYVTAPGKFDEVVAHEDVRVVIDSKALFSIVGSEMDWVEDALRCVCRRVCKRDAERRAAPSSRSGIQTSRTSAGAGSPSGYHRLRAGRQPPP